MTYEFKCADCNNELRYDEEYGVVYGTKISNFWICHDCEKLRKTNKRKPTLKLNLGCGTDIKIGYTNVDKYSYDGVDKIIDIEKEMPFYEDSFIEIIAQDIIEHTTNPEKVIIECARILKKDGKLYIRVPHFTFRNSFDDITHKKQFSITTFNNFVKKINQPKQGELYGFRVFKDITRKIGFEKRPVFFWNYILEWFVNINDFTQNFYERTPLRIFPATNIEVILIK
jgi:predicted SAM-dependent methyltransferase